MSKAKIILKTRCPSYYNAYLDGKYVAQIRVRGRICDVWISDGPKVYEECVRENDAFESDAERDDHLKSACEAILAYLEPLYEIVETDET